jgi:hypothetical protein
MAQSSAQIKRKQGAKARAGARGVKIVEGGPENRKVKKVMTFKELMAQRKSKKALEANPKARAGQRKRKAGQPFTVKQLESMLKKAKKKR